MMQLRRDNAHALTAADHAERLQFAEVSAVVIRKDGRIEDLGVIDRFESTAHQAERLGLGPATVSKADLAFRALRRTVRKFLPWTMLALLAHAAVTHHAHETIVPAASVITNAGQAIDTNLVSGLGGTVPKYIAWGTGAGTSAITDTTLFTESGDETRTTGTPTRVTTTVTNDTVQVAGTMTCATTGKTITNCGLFDAVTTGNNWFKSDFTGVVLAVADAIAFTIKVKYS